VEQPTTPEDEQVRDVFAHFGLAAYCAQLFEKGLCNFLVVYKMLTGELVTLADFDAAERKVHRKTLGMLLKDIRPLVTFSDPDGEKLLDDAVVKRNYLQHDYFWDRAVEFASVVGRGQMITELDELRLLFERAEEVAMLLTQATRRAVGLPDNYFEKGLAEMRERVRLLDAAGRANGM